MGNHRAERSGSRRSEDSETPPSVQGVQRSAAGKRRAVKPSASRSPLAKGLPSAPVIAGVAALAISAGGAITAAGAGAKTARESAGFTTQASALNGASAVSRASLLAEREEAVSRDSRRDAQQDTADAELTQAAQAQAQERSAALAEFAAQAERQAEKIALNAWVLPVEGYRLTNTFGLARSYYSSGYHTGLDFAAAYGTPIKAVANGVVTFAAYDGSYGYRTVITLEDGTEIWYAHQATISVSVGESVNAGDIVGSVGSTGNSTGPHVHVEVRPGAGDPVDPYEAFVVHGVTP